MTKNLPNNVGDHTRFTNIPSLFFHGFFHLRSSRWILFINGMIGSGDRVYKKNRKR